MGDNRSFRGLAVLGFLVFGLWSIAANSLTPVNLGPAAIAGLACLWFGTATANPVWRVGGLYFVALVINAAMWVLTPVSFWDTAADIALFALVSFGAAGAWMAARPFVSDGRFRNSTRLTVAGLLCVFSSAVLLDVRFAAALDDPVLVMVFSLLGVLGLALLLTGCLLVARSTSRSGRQVEAVLAIGTIVYVSIHLTGMVLQYFPLVRLGPAFAAAAVLLAISSSGASDLGSPLDKQTEIFRVRLWPIIAGSMAMALAHLSLQRDLDSAGAKAVAAIAIFGAMATMLFAMRELGGPRKPLTIPFSDLDRALQKLPSTLLAGNVQLVGHPVRRSTDSTIIGIEAHIDWASPNENAVPIGVAAEEAGLCSLLDSVTLDLAQAHLPAVLHGIDADEPWLSVPLHTNTLAASALPDSGSVDGLVLRVPTIEVAIAIDELRDHGAMLQASDWFAGDVEAEIVDGLPSGHNGGYSLCLVPLSALPSSVDRAHVNLVVDDNGPPAALGAILGRVKTGDAATVRPIPFPDDGR